MLGDTTVNTKMLQKVTRCPKGKTLLPKSKYSIVRKLDQSYNLETMDNDICFNMFE